jgi:hypothetical protein
MGVGADIVEYLAEFHTTEDTAIKAKELRALFNLQDKQLRNVISVLRQNGEPICSSSNGYWYSKEPEDISKTIRRMEAQVLNMRHSIAGLYKNLYKENTEDEIKG